MMTMPRMGARHTSQSEDRSALTDRFSTDAEYPHDYADRARTAHAEGATNRSPHTSPSPQHA
ncbi:hypothetical protein ABTB95_19535 [Acinetobacter baumannii]